ncbi:Bifunctional NAD(P)H-hydrate repair enzyme Nnr [Nocardioides dokdonensis FR1436]|uniref:NAD(P)H-hydrate epimerase n=1 Tax=Nocardioides dokdonensis FR1436 TaxID=1300347 RepID=A0A1A9GMS7_9ACTN|nr:NAD(P)H-hydrate epimerase [Nocardioides dokdonensis]ANH39598.1 Bifunctional NAD(P)H-hydrate repair enzyme Nnr [Nocardioides dokdonensis FR1436]
MDSFVSEAGLVVPAVTTEQMREVDRVAIEGIGPNLYQMMENAGRNLALSCVEMLGEGWATSSVVVLAGTGGNGGGGICAARHLANHGGQVTLVVSDVERLAGVPAEQLALFRASGGRLAAIGDLGTLETSLTVDAVLGYSLAGAPHGAAADLIGWMSQGPAPVVSLDVPSGVDATTGEAPGVHVRAATTMALALPKTGLAVDATGEIWLADIGIPAGVLERARVRPPPAGLFSKGYRVRLSWSS